MLKLARIPSPLGTLLFVTDEAERVRALDFEECEARMRTLLERHLGDGGSALFPGSAPRALEARLAAFFGGELGALADVEVRTSGTPFQERVWSALRQIAPGRTTSYGQLAAELGNPAASRAVGLANGSNPVALLIPCHRVIGARGDLTGYAGGLGRKRWLLEHEHRKAGRQS